MDIRQPFLEFLNKFIPVSEDEFGHIIAPFTEIRKFGKKQVITEPGSVEKYFNFILKGLVRKYYVKDKEEFITQISYEGHFIMVHESMFSQTPSDFGLETIESTTLLSISFENLEKIFSQSAKWERLGRLIIIRTMMVKDKWQTQLVMHSPRERFIAFVNKNPELLQRVPQKFLASYLNIKPETFSRFKHLVRGSG